MPTLKFVTLDVFTTTRYVGNPLAIVHIPPRTKLSPDLRLKIAAEFNLSETVFIHDLDLEGSASASVEGAEVELNIHTPHLEIPFAGHPTIGTGFHLLSNLPPTFTTATPNRSTTLLTRAGKIPVTHSTETGLTRLEVPHAFQYHGALPREFIGRAIGLSTDDAHTYIVPNDPNGSDGSDGVAIVSVVKGMPFALIQVSSVEALSKTRGTHIVPASEFGSEGKPAAMYLYYVTSSEESKHEREGGGTSLRRVAIRSRMYYQGTIEDPATGSGASCLCGFLSTARGAGASDGINMDEYHITQGVEMGRTSDILVDVRTKPPLTPGGRDEVETMWLSGRCIEVMQGILTI